MQYTELGATGLEVSRLCFGTSRFDREVSGEIQTTRDEAHTLLSAFAEHGGNFIDTAEIYGGGSSESWIGEWLDGRDREDYVLASKIAGPRDGRPNRSGLSRKRVRAAVTDTLERLGTDYLDICYIHWWDDATPIEETITALSELVREGTIHYLGASNVSSPQLVTSLWRSDVAGAQRFDILQPRYNAAYREEPAELLEVCKGEGIGICPYSALEQGFLTGKYERTANGVVGPERSRGELQEWAGFEERQWRVLEAVREVADAVEATPTQVALRWLMDHERFTCVPIVAARTVEQLEDNAGAVEVELSTEQREQITEAYTTE